MRIPPDLVPDGMDPEEKKPEQRKNDASDLYRIGEYARYLGVTPDLLKHYERYGLVASRTRASGYRYYPFGQSTSLLESMAMRNLGFSLRECDELQNACGEEELFRRLEEQAEKLKAEIERRQEFLRDYRQTMEYIRRLGDRSRDWWIAESEPMLFLPHANLRTFIDDPKIYDILPEWIRWMPVVKSAVTIRKERPADMEKADWRDGCIWGLIADEAAAHRIGLPDNGAAERIPAQKCLYYYYRGCAGGLSGMRTIYIQLWQLLDRLAITPSGPIRRISVLRSSRGQEKLHQGFYIVPLTDTL